MMKRKIAMTILAISLLAGALSGCKSANEPDDYATNEGYEKKSTSVATTDESTAEDADVTETEQKDVKVGVIYISDPNEGS